MLPPGPFGPAFWVGQARPSWLAVALVAASVIVGVLGGMLATLFVADGTVEPTAVPVLYALLGLTPIGIGLAISGIFAGGSLPRAVLFGLASLVFAGEIGVFGVSFLIEGDVLSAVAVSVVFFGPLLLLSLPPAIGFGIGSGPELRKAHRQAREEWATTHLADRSASLAGVGEVLGLSAEQSEDLLHGLVEEDQLQGSVEGGCWFADTAAAELQERLLTAVEQEGGIGLEELARRIGLPEDPTSPTGLPDVAVRSWLYELVYRGRFAGYVNWSEKRVYAAAAEQLRERSRCPSCGDSLTLGRGGAIRCRGCGVDVMVST